jgi:hypothetical protein
MKKSLETRLAELEKLHERERLARAHSAREADGSGLEWVRRLLKVLGTAQGRTESLAEALARAMQISVSDLKTRLGRSSRRLVLDA